ncbi:MAG: GNAT family N-acetyltransferase [Bacteroidales bacterium]|jgi:predicted acetyltransferase|nr:GNAT family N-acetyltransferase [Bacteroidales bacterium]MDD4703484.1 GNAT family N-acetyltransferase [Bacteroidales bacterium]MDX9798372.1 GNAT family N-acetyltransferase [Bacteroidales bacterium]
MEQRVKEIWNKHFGDDLDFLNKYFSTFYEPNNLIINPNIEENGFIYMTLIVRYDYKYYNEILPIGYITAVLTNPEYRNQGYFRITMHEVFQKLIENDFPISCLIPATEQLLTTYIRYGYSNCFTDKREKDNNKSIIHNQKTFMLYKELGYNITTLKPNTNAMIRIIDVVRVMEAYAKSNPSLVEKYKIIDNQIQKNNLYINVSNGEIELNKKDGSYQEINISELTKLIFNGSYMDLMFDN